MAIYVKVRGKSPESHFVQLLGRGSLNSNDSTIKNLRVTSRFRIKDETSCNEIFLLNSLGNIFTI